MPYAIPTTPERRLLRAGFAKATTWRAAVAMAALKELRAKSITGLVRAQDYSPHKHFNQGFVTGGVLTNVKAPEPAISGDMLYDDGSLGTFLALLFGTAGAGTQQAATTAYKHTLQWADLVAGFGTLVAEFPGLVQEVASLLPTEFGFKVADGKIVFEAKGRGNTVEDDSAVNGATQTGLLTFGGQDTDMLFSQTAIKMNAASGADVAGTTAWEISNFEASYKRAYDSNYVAGFNNITRSRENGFPEIKLKLDFPTFASENQALQAAMKAGTLQKVLVTMTSPLEAGTGYPYSMKLFFPQMRIVNVSPDWGEIVKNGIELVAEQAAAAPTGMSYTRPYIERIVKQSADYLA